MAIIRIARTHDLAVDESRFNDQIREFIWNYGIRQILNDAGSAFKSADEKLGAAQKKLDALYAGIVRKTREGKNPVESMRLKVAREFFKDIFGTGKSLAVAKLAAEMAKRDLEFTDLEDDDNRDLAIETMVEYMADNSPKVHAEADKRLAAKPVKSAELDELF